MRRDCGQSIERTSLNHDPHPEEARSGHNFSPHPEEARSAVSKDEATYRAPAPFLILRDAPNGAPQDEDGEAPRVTPNSIP
jgi:hypothetical protein